MGSAGAKAAAVICGAADAYVHSGGQYEWDSAAPVAVAWAAGLHASRIDGSKLSYNQAPPSRAGYPDLPGRARGHASRGDQLRGAAQTVSPLRRPATTD